MRGHPFTFHRPRLACRPFLCAVLRLLFADAPARISRLTLVEIFLAVAPIGVFPGSARLLAGETTRSSIKPPLPHLASRLWGAACLLSVVSTYYVCRFHHTPRSRSVASAAVHTFFRARSHLFHKARPATLTQLQFGRRESIPRSAFAWRLVPAAEKQTVSRAVGTPQRRCSPLAAYHCSESRGARKRLHLWW